ncbi:lycopene cyclase domain-containing protein [Mucilaginibacter gotjawali]|uniref:Lycopene cyclase domain-containing protein n=1 Tax=Mucilaginibacter gotjawali TaxID=1550579 RepID=A0A839SMH4_9SPHI|nr:lycopene cyclase domain-containing protein [Mucilaginibacter gotjawali]MBB3058434.1 lycopene cyclase domain-containing protein [Mucilaginibacter gotjawali]
MKFTYLLVDFFTVLIPFVFSFHPQIKFYKHWPALFPAMIVTGIIFIAWDMYFTQLKIWGFNPDYLTGVYMGSLPVEEVLFFFCIPYSCIFTYACFNVLFKKRLSERATLFISTVLIVLSAFMVILFSAHFYTVYTFASLAILLFTAQYILKVTWLSVFYITYLALLLPFFIVNGLLTGTGLQAPVVWYNPAQIINLRMLTIPFEDIFYGMDLILLNMIIYTFLIKKKLPTTKYSAGIGATTSNNANSNKNP